MSLGEHEGAGEIVETSCAVRTLPFLVCDKMDSGGLKLSRLDTESVCETTYLSRIQWCSIYSMEGNKI